MEMLWDPGRHSVIAQLCGDTSGGNGGGASPAGPVADRQKYRLEGQIGRGGMGEVLLVTDQDLRRQVAMKVLLPEASKQDPSRLNFVAEAQATSQLEHPGIPPVHDIGMSPDGRVYFTMKLVRGRTLREILHDLFVRRVDVQREWSMHRLVTVLERLCETLHFTHERGVIHRDVKPDNVMLGDFGEVHLMDWGLARIEGVDPEAALPEAEAVHTARTDVGVLTEHGTLKGTVPYMAPEQVGGRADRRSDVYALGCLLYEVLTLQPAFIPGPDLIAKVLAGDFPPVTTRNLRRAVPDALADACLKAMSRDPSARFPTARAMGETLRSWLDGTSERDRRHKDAEAFAAKGLQSVAVYERALATLEEAEARADRLAEDIRLWQPVSEKRPLLEARKQAEAAASTMALAFGEASKWFDAAVAQEERNATARGALARLWRHQLEMAERRDDRADAAYALQMLRRFDDGSVSTDGRLLLTSKPEGARVTLYTYVESDGVLVASEPRDLGTTPLEPVTLPMGSYLCVLRMPGFRDVRYPVHITYDRTWQGCVRLRTEGEIGADFVYVPGGPFVYGEGRATRTLELPDFAIGRSPVLFHQYAEFLASLEASGGPESVLERLPRTYDGAPRMEKGEDGRYHPLSIVVDGGARERCLQQYGPGFEENLPVYGVCWDDAAAYCEWRTQTTRREWRLPTEEEREKAARGVDGRRFPWGAFEDSTLAKCRDSKPENPQIEPAGGFPTAESVYGMGDAAGNVWDWTDSWFDERRSARVLRGGSWSVPVANLRAAMRGSNPPAVRSAIVGFRCARTLAP
jgi:serine/threonine-protein kinase